MVQFYYLMPINETFANSLQDDKGIVLILAGPNGAGKDTLERAFAAAHDSTRRITRHTTRKPFGAENRGDEYYFVDDNTFSEMVQRGAFIEHAAYPGVQSGTTYSSIEEAINTGTFATITMNFADGLALARRLKSVDIGHVCFFVGPCPETTMLQNSRQYLTILAERMVGRARVSDDIIGRLIMAAEYRDLYIQYADEAVFIDNSSGHLDEALSQLESRLAL